VLRSFERFLSFLNILRWSAFLSSFYQNISKIFYTPLSWQLIRFRLTFHWSHRMYLSSQSRIWQPYHTGGLHPWQNPITAPVLWPESDKFCLCNIRRRKFRYKTEEEATGWRNVQREDSVIILRQRLMRLSEGWYDGRVCSMHVKMRNA
jgi:hypothetical protein